MSKLEEDLSVVLFYRANKGILLTPSGEVLLKYLKETKNLLQSCERVLLSLNDTEDGNLVIGVQSHIVRNYLMEKIENFRKKHPNIKIKLLDLSTLELMALLQKRTLDFVIDSSPVESIYNNIKIESICSLKTSFIKSSSNSKNIKRFFLTEKKRRKAEFKKIIDELIPAAKSIIDISCGDNSDIFDLCKKKKFNIIVGNDIGLNYLKSINMNGIIFTNENVELNKFKPTSFDVSYCKNTLHHMNNLTNINNMLEFLKEISDDIIIIEIENPCIKGGLPKFLNKYLYGFFLKDVGKCYLNYKQFKTIIEKKFNKIVDYEISYSKFENVLGNYMIAKISRRRK